MKTQTSKTALQKQDTIILTKQKSSSRQSSINKSFTKQSSKDRSVTKQTSKQGSVTKQTSKKPSVTKLASKKASLIKQACSHSGLTKQASLQKSSSKTSLSGVRTPNKGVKRPSSQNDASQKKRTRTGAAPSTQNDIPKKKRKRKNKTNKGEKLTRTVLFKKNVFVAVRSDQADEPFYIAETQSVVWSDTNMARIHWFSTRDQLDGVYVRNFMEKVETECLICCVRMMKRNTSARCLPASEKQKIENELKRAINKEQGKSDGQETPRKTKRGQQSSKHNLKKQGNKVLKKTSSTKAKMVSARGIKAELKRKEQEEKRRLREEAKKEKALLAKNPNARLKYRGFIKPLTKDPMLESKSEVPFISTSAHSKLVHRAVRLNDHALLKRLIDNVSTIDMVNRPYSVGFRLDPIHMALDAGDATALQLLTKEVFNRDPKKKARVSDTQSILAVVDTGRYNPHSLGVRHIRAIAMSRGSKEGNNAFTKDPPSYCSIITYIRHALRSGVTKKTMDVMLAAANKSVNKCQVHENIWLAVRWGNRKLAGELIKEQQAMGMSSFNTIHRDVLLLDGEDLKGPIRAASVRKKPWDNRKVTPIHCAAINPNVKYLAKLIQVVPEYGIIDEKLARPIHYAAACEGPGPLEFLLKRGQDPFEPEGSGLCVLHIACETGRLANVKLLLERAEQEKQEAEENPPGDADDEEYGLDAAQKMYGVGGVNKPVTKPQNMYCSCTPLHIAAEKGHTEIVKVLLKHGAEINKELNAGKDKKTAFMQACRAGHLDTCKALFAAGAAVDNQDKLKKSPLMHAVMCGHAHIVSFLLNIGVNVNRPDSSGNTCVHYAAGYGWYHCLKLLLEAGADANVSNDWKTPPLGIAFLKGHTGLADLLLDHEGVNINFKDSQGMTLVALACGSPLTLGIEDQLDYLINQKHADSTLLDVGKNSPLHHLASNNIRMQSDFLRRNMVDEDAVRRSIDIARILIDHGCDPGAENEIHVTPIMAAVETGNTKLAEFLIGQGGEISDATNSEKQNILHVMAQRCTSTNLAPLLKIINRSMSGVMLKRLVTAVDNQGLTPLLSACHVYQKWDGLVGGPNTLSDAQRKLLSNKMWSEARDFIETLIKLFGSDPSATVEKKQGAPETYLPEDEKKCYLPKIGKFNAVHFLISTPAEDAVTVKNALNREPGLTMILKYKPDVNARDVYGRLPIHTAVDNGHRTILQKLLDAGSHVNVESTKEDQNATPIMLACKRQHEDCMRMLIKHGADVNYVEPKTGMTPLHYIAKTASAMHMIDMLKILLDAGATINCKDVKGRTALHYLVNLNQGSTDVSSEAEQYLIDRGSDVYVKDIHGRPPLHYVFVKMGRHTDSSSTDPIELCSTLTNAMRGRLVDEADNYGQTPLHRAAIRGAGVCCMHLIQKKAKINALDNEKNSALALAIRSGHESCTIMLIQKNANIGVNLYKPPPAVKVVQDEDDNRKKEKPAWQWKPMRNKENNMTTVTPLFQEVTSREWQGVLYIMLDLLTDFGVKYAQTVEAALYTQKYHLAMTLIRKAPDSRTLQETNLKGWSLFHVLANQANYDTTLQERVADMLMNHKVKIHSEDIYKCTPLHLACLHGNLSLASYILNHVKGSCVDATDTYKRTPLAAVFWKNNVDNKNTWMISERLSKEGSDMDVLCDYHDVDSELFGHKPVNRDPTYFQCGAGTRITPLIVSIRRRHFNLVKQLLHQNANVNSPDELGRTPMMHAVQVNDTSIVRLLLNKQYEIPTLQANEKVQPSSTAVRRGILRKVRKPQIAGVKRTNKHRPFMIGKKKKKTYDIIESDMEDEEEEEGEEDNRLAAIIEVINDQDIDLDFPKVSNSNKVSLQTQDDDGKTVLHHLVCSLDHGTYDNVEILKLLIDAGASLLQTDDHNKLPLDYALSHGANKLVKAIQKLMGKKKHDWKSPKISVPKVKDPMKNVGSTPDFGADSQALLDMFEADCAAEEGLDSAYKPEPNPILKMGKTGEVMKDESIDLHYDVLLTKIDVKAGYWGLYNYYIMQVVHEKGRDIFVLLTRWGRIGDDGQYQRTPFPTLAEAVKEFISIFRSKTGNQWKNIKLFENKPKKYRLVQAEQRSSGKKLKELKLDLKSNLPSKLPEELQDMMKEMTDTQTMTNTIKRMGVSEELMPFGRIKKEALLKAVDILKKIKNLVKVTKEAASTSPIVDIDTYQENLEEISNLSSEYYHLIPQNGYSVERISPLHTDDKVQNEWKHVETLLELERASKVLAGAQYRIKEQNPLDYVYQSLGCNIEPLSEDDPTSQYILRYIRSTYKGKVEGIFAVSRHGEADRISNTGIPNHMLLFHGSSTANLISILSRGLLVAPHEAPATGYMFGKGIYMADMFSKSAGYCYNWSSDSKTKFMLVCQVALGNIHDFYTPTYMEKPTLGYHSTKGCGGKEPDPNHDMTLSDGCVLPLGVTRSAPKPERFTDTGYHSYHLSHSEYIVYKENQVCLRYIIQFK